MYTVHETILSYMILSQNVKQVGYPLLREAADLSWYKLFKKTKESVVRKWVPVVKGNIVLWPRSVENLLGVYVVDSCGELAALYEDNFKNIDIPPKEKCTCNGADTGECLCAAVQPVILQTDVTINGQQYTNKSYTRVLKNGEVVEQTHTWMPAYGFNGVITGVEEVVKQITRCQVEVLPGGCVADTGQNASLLFECGCIVDCNVPWLRERYPSLYNEFGYYKTDETDRTIHLFDSNGKKSRLKQVKLVYQSNGSDMLVPDYARMALIALLDFTRKMYSPSHNPTDRVEAKRNAARENTEMLKYLNPIPYEWMVQGSDPLIKGNRPPYYRGVHSDFIKPQIVSGPPSPALPVQHIVNNTYPAQTIAARWLKVVVDEPGGPVSGQPVFQHNSLVGLGKNTGDKVEIVLDKIEMYNWGPVIEFTLNKVMGTITMLNGYQFQPGSSLKTDLNQ